MRERLKREIKEFGLLMRSVPPIAVAIFIVSVCAMNLLANKSIYIPTEWFALDCGIIMSWFAFISMDVLTKRFGPKAATEISVLAVLFNLVLCLMFFLGSLIPGDWSEALSSMFRGEVNEAIDNTFGGTWYVLLGSTVAFLASAVINNFVNFAIGKRFKKNPDGAAAFFTRSYVSTAIAQLVDNLVFAFIVSYIIFDWSPVACITCAATGMVVELCLETVFSPLGYKICNKWQRDNVGAAYLEHIEAKKAGSDDLEPTDAAQNAEPSPEITEEKSA